MKDLKIALLSSVITAILFIALGLVPFLTDTFFSRFKVLAQTVPWTLERDSADADKLKIYKGDKSKSPLIVDPNGPVNVTGKLNAVDAQVNKLYLGNKWMLSGVGDAHSNDSWLRLFNTGNTGYYGGIAMDNLWVNKNFYVGGVCFRPRDLYRCLKSADHLTWVDNASECTAAGYSVQGSMKILAQC